MNVTSLFLYSQFFRNYSFYAFVTAVLSTDLLNFLVRSEQNRILKQSHRFQMIHEFFTFINLWRDGILTKQAQLITIFHSQKSVSFFFAGTVPNSCHDGPRLCLDWGNFTLFNGISGL